MTLPTFLGIGVPRAGTTWLYELLASHPDIYVSTRRKEVHFFDRHYERGIQWYEKFFPSSEQSCQYQAIGEITPHYLYRPHCPERIAATLSNPKLILMLRNPVDRAYSHYCFRVRIDNYSGSFESFLSTCSAAIQWGFYSPGLKSYFGYFARKQFLILIYEQVVADVPRVKNDLSSFLGVAVDRFPMTAGTERVNPAYIPRARSVYAFVVSIARNLRKRDLDWVVNLGRNLGIKHLFSEGNAFPSMKEATRVYLKELYDNEVEELESVLQIDLGVWR